MRRCTSCTKNGGIPLAKSPERNRCGKICSHHGAKLDENRTSTLKNSTTMLSVGSLCRLAVISPTDPPRAGAHHHGKKVQGRLSASFSQQYPSVCETADDLSRVEARRLRLSSGRSTRAGQTLSAGSRPARSSRRPR